MSLELFLSNTLVYVLLTLQSLRKVGKDTTVLLICITVFLSYLPEAGQYSSFFLYLRQVSFALLGGILIVFVRVRVCVLMWGLKDL